MNSVHGRPVDERRARQRVEVEVFVSVEDRRHLLGVAVQDRGHELVPYWDVVGVHFCVPSRRRAPARDAAPGAGRTPVYVFSGLTYAQVEMECHLHTGDAEGARQRQTRRLVLKGGAVVL